MIGGLPFGPDCPSNSTQRLESPRQVGPSGFSSLYILRNLLVSSFFLSPGHTFPTRPVSLEQ